VPNNQDEIDRDAAGGWAKKYFFASRALLESVLRPFDLGNTQFYILSVLATDGPLGQRELTRQLEVERATLSAMISALVRKGLITQTGAPDDQRQKVLDITPAGRRLWAKIPNPLTLIASVAFDGVDPDDLATARRVLVDATARLSNYKKGMKQ
jgi:DNA-binding MarR family transcriptional regulator